ncbi:twin-arginine translocase TatA/TatE family subunit [Planctomycetota bacterium]
MIEHMRHILAWGGIPGGWEWIVILIVALLIFGKRLPEIARSIGKSLTAFKKGVREAEDTKDELLDEVKKVKDEVVNESKDAAGLGESEKND